ncbi:hypothetical protein B0T10DRAFT_10184 [Thelonectria olida]|uniref:Developmental regulatory protein wetA n=1 Tax=Thelonectria olida TaxID=1576542 RepID=A0A9P8WI34_9HYPO|nr:hypothetical protein B0T10DRAFT_10184 [Thelonectria olida]
MASWTLPYRVEAVDRDPSFYWQDVDDGPNDFFGEFINFDGDVTSSMANPHGNDPSLPTMPDPLILDQPSESTISSGVSTIEDEYDFLSSSSQVGHAMPTACVGTATRELDPRHLILPGSDNVGKIDGMPRISVSDPELPRVEGISLHSPTKRMPVSQPSSPTPPSTVVPRKSNKFVEALSSTLRKAGRLRKGRRSGAGEDRPGSPTMDNPPRALRLQAFDYEHGSEVHTSSPSGNPDHGGFIHGYFDDPFTESPVVVVAEPGSYENDMSSQGDPGTWPLPAQPHAQQQHHVPPQELHPPHQHSIPTPGSVPESWQGSEYMNHHHSAGWWDLNLLSQNGECVIDPQQQHQRHATMNMAMHAQHAELPYDCHGMPDASAAGLMIHMPQPRGAPPTIANDLAVTAQTYLPPPPPIPQACPPTERQRPPRAPSSGARHLSCSPIRKSRAPPSPQPAHSRHSSGGSVGSTRSASGRGMVPGTPTAMRKQRRSRDASGGSIGGEIGFVNFTPSDGSLLMTGVAPSGSSKTKARREREAMERRRRLSEAALKAVQAAGGDVDKLMQQGFTL